MGAYKETLADEARAYRTAARKARRYAAMPQHAGQRAHLLRLAREHDARAREIERAAAVNTTSPPTS